jgi:hypothetical protein
VVVRVAVDVLEQFGMCLRVPRVDLHTVTSPVSGSQKNSMLNVALSSPTPLTTRRETSANRSRIRSGSCDGYWWRRKLATPGWTSESNTPYTTTSPSRT